MDNIIFIIVYLILGILEFGFFLYLCKDIETKEGNVNLKMINEAFWICISASPVAIFIGIALILLKDLS